jgi:DNA-binding GntR family transcriptional regulator
VAAAFGQIGDRIDPAEKKKIEQAAAEVREALASHDARKLQSANGALDEATQSLAAAIVERAIQISKL